MNCSVLGFSHRKLAVIALTAGAIAVSACSTVGTSSSTSPLSNRAIKKATEPYSWSWVRVQPSGDPTEVTGINNLTGTNGPEIVGFYTTNASASNAESFSFTSKGTSYSTFGYHSYPAVHNGQGQPGPSSGTQMYGIETQAKATDPPILAGFVSQPGDQGGGWPVVDNQGLWALEYDGLTTQGGSVNVIAKLFGINDSNIAVGFTANYPASSSTSQASYFSTAGEPNNVPLAASNLNLTTPSVAYGINDQGDMVGTATQSGGGVVSWYALCVTSCPTVGNTSKGYCWGILTNGDYTSKTTAYSISGPAGIISGGYQIRLVAGSYVVGSGANKVTHGFVVPVTLTSSGTSTGCEQIGTPQTVDEKDADNFTVVRGVNDQAYIVGYYVDSSGKQYGFVGTPTSGLAHRRQTKRSR